MKTKTLRILDLDDCIDKYNAVFDEVANCLVGREQEVNALKICLASEQHLMLQGLHGTAKSLLLSEFSRRVTGLTYFKRLLMENTQSDEVFGPMNTRRYREDAVWEVNTDGMLPCAHVALLEEVYRAPGGVLNSILSVLNERYYDNGSVRQSCPLMTAVGTTNSIPDDEEMHAFQDRWLAHVVVEPLSRPSHRVMMLSNYLAGQQPVSATISLEEVRRVQQAIRNHEIPKGDIQEYDNLVHKYTTSVGNKYISDRRRCLLLRFLQAHQVLGHHSDMLHAFEVARFGLAVTTTQSEAFMQLLSRELEEASLRSREETTLQTLESAKEFHEQTFNRYSNRKLPRAKALEHFNTVLEDLNALENATPDERMKTEAGRRRYDAVLVFLRRIANSYAEALGVPAPGASVPIPQGIPTSGAAATAQA